MDGPSLITFSVAEVPKLVGDVLKAAGLTQDDIALFIMHQATDKMLSQLMERLGLNGEACRSSSRIAATRSLRRFRSLSASYGPTAGFFPARTICWLVSAWDGLGPAAFGVTSGPSPRRPEIGAHVPPDASRCIITCWPPGSLDGGFAHVFTARTFSRCLASSARSEFLSHGVLMVQHDQQGAVGLILNRITNSTIGELWETVVKEPFRRGSR